MAGGHPPKRMSRIQQAVSDLLRHLTYTEHVMADEGETIPPKVRAAIATVRVWCRDTGSRQDIRP